MNRAFLATFKRSGQTQAHAVAGPEKFKACVSASAYQCQKFARNDLFNNFPNQTSFSSYKNTFIK